MLSYLSFSILQQSQILAWPGLPAGQPCVTGDVVMCSGAYVTLVTDWCCVVGSGGYVTGDRLVSCSV